MDIKEQRFVQRLRDKIVSLPFDLKVFFALMADEDQPEPVRLLAAGTVIYVLGPNDIIPDHIMPVGYADDAMILWASVDELRRTHPEVVEKFSSRFEGVFEAAEETVAIFSEYLGELFEWLRGKLPELTSLAYKGKKAADYLADSEAGDFLYTEAMAFTTDFDLDEEYLDNHLKGRLVVDALQKRLKEESMRSK